MPQFPLLGLQYHLLQGVPGRRRGQDAQLALLTPPPGAQKPGVAGVSHRAREDPKLDAALEVH